MAISLIQPIDMRHRLPDWAGDGNFGPMDWAAASAPPAFATPAFATPDPVASLFAVLATSTVSAGAAMAMRVAQAVKAYGVTGAGIKIGILSDSFNLHGGMAADIANGNLNAGTTILKEGPAGGADEGRAMAELIHKIAPGAQITFYSAFYGEADFANGIQALTAAACNVIVDDVTYLTEPFFQTGGLVQNAVQAAINAGVSYFTSASNEGLNFYQANFTGVKTTLTGLIGNYTAENFGTAAVPVTRQSLTIARGATATIDLQWDQPFAGIGGKTGAANSLGMVLYDSNNRIVAYATMNDVNRNPDQILQFTNTSASTSFHLAIFTNGGTSAPGQFKYIIYGQGTMINDPKAGKGSGTLIGHEEVAAANTVGAVAYNQTAAYGGRNTIEHFSSVGPGGLLFDANGNRLAQAATSGVDFVAPDGSATSVFNPFYGTSAAAPNAAGVAALMLQANRALTPAQVSADLLASTIAATGPNGAVGAGLIQAPAAVRMAFATTAGVAATPQTSRIGSTSTSTSIIGRIGTVARNNLTAAPASLARALDLVASDPTAAGDFYASLDPTAAIAPAAILLSAAGTSALAMLNNASMPLPFVAKWNT